jgi:hypothetical protein
MINKSVARLVVVVIISLFLALALLIPLMTKAQTTSHYGANVGDSGANLVGFDLTMYNPINQKVYSKTMPLDFNIHWIVGVYPFFNWTFAGIYTYSIDNMSPIVIESNQSSNEKYDAKTDFKYNPSFSYILDISNLTDGVHKIVVSAGMYYNSNGHLMDDIFNETSSPIYFQVQNSNPVSTPSPSPTPTPTVPEFSWLIILPLFLSILFIVVLFRKRKVSYSYD